MNYHLVLQFEAEDSADLEGVAELESRLIKLLGKKADVDGHDIDGDTASLLIFTDAPDATWEAIEPTVEKAAEEGLELSVVAYRAVDSDSYEVLWPEDFEGEFDLA